MIISLKFFYYHLQLYQIGLFGFFLLMHISSYMWHLEADKYLTKSIPGILANPNNLTFSSELTNILMVNVGYLMLYAVTMFAIEAIGKIAIRNAINNISKKLLKADLTKISKTQYEHEILSVVHHSENITSVIRNLFIEFPRKIVASYHFMVALKELSFEIMIYCTIANILFILTIIIITYARKYLLSKVVDANINYSIICSDLANSIQTYKIDNRTEEYQNKIKKLSSTVWYYSSLDSLMVAGNESITSFSGQFMIGLISYMCRPMVISKTIKIEDLMYGVTSSAKFIEKMIGILEYFGDVIRQYKSFNFFISVHNETPMEKMAPTEIPSNIKIITKNNTFVHPSNNTFVHASNNNCDGKLIRIAGTNGVGKTTLLLKFLGVSYQGATCVGLMQAFNNDQTLEPTSYRNNIAFVQQNVPFTHDTIKQYIAAVSKSNEDINILLNKTLKYFVTDKTNQIINFVASLGENKPIRELSGGQSKFIQIIAAIIKLYVLNGFVLMLDEPSNNLDTVKVSYAKKIIKACISRGVIVYIITHDDRMVDDLNHDTIELC
jgi:ABC-type bacteriocin/lantibiotic exporter with double-glycine peptidase domain